MTLLVRWLHQQNKDITNSQMMQFYISFFKRKPDNLNNGLISFHTIYGLKVKLLEVHSVKDIVSDIIVIYRFT